jgi:competence protein ComEA
VPTDRSPQDRLAGLVPASAPRAAGAPEGGGGRPGQVAETRPVPLVDAPAATTSDDDAAAVRSRALAAATSAYAATYGHPLEHPTTSGPVRWGTSARAALAVAGALALVGGGVVVHVLAGAPASVLVAEDVVPAAPAPAAPAEPPTGDAATAAADVAPGDVLVHVVGSVHAPGVVELPAGARVVDAVAAAGGATAEADLSALNLARPVVDGEQVLVPRPGEVPPLPAGGLPAGGAASGPAETAGPVLVDVNRATAGELEALPGIGPVLAERIVAHREEHGPFAAVDDLQGVRGIGPSLLADLRELVTA